MRPISFILLSAGLLIWGQLKAQDVETQYLKLQESYSQRVQDISQRHQTIQREYLNKFILALVRIEQGYRDDGELDGVMHCRGLRDQLLLNPEIPEIDPAAPEIISEMQKTLHEKRRENTEQHQKELDQVNFMLLNALEAYQREYTRQGLTEKAVEIQDLRNVLTESHNRSQALARSKQTLSSNLSANPNLYPFAFEGKEYKNHRGVIPRSCMIELTPKVTGWVKDNPLGLEFIKGRVVFPANESGPLLQDIARNHMFSAEIAFIPTYNFQGSPDNPVVIFQLGETPESALFSLTMEKHELYMHLKTDQPPADRGNHRYLIGEISTLDPVHIVTTYRSGELYVYLNGVESLKIRNEINGGLQKWQETPIVMGRALRHEKYNFTLPFRGTLNHVYLKASELSSRQVVANYNRYLLLFN